MAPARAAAIVRAMSLSLREKENFYRSLGQLLRSGVPFPAALESLARTSRGSLKTFISGLKAGSVGGGTVAEAFATLRPAVSEMEVTTLSAVERTGKLERGLAQLAEYFGAMAGARSSFWKKSAYPLFILHFGVLALNLPQALFGGGVSGYLRQTGGTFALIYGLAICVALLVPLLRDAGATSRGIDSLLRALPLIGGLRQAFALSRFCSTYGMQLDAGVNVIDALESAGAASRSGLIASAVKSAVPEVRGGMQVGPLLAGSGAFPQETIRSICVGEDTGELDRELQRLAAEHQAEGLDRLETLADWLPKILYLIILVALAYGIVNGYRLIFAQYGKILEG